MTVSNRHSALLSFLGSSITMRGVIGLLSISAVVAAEAPPYCAFEVRVSEPSGVPFAKVPVGMVQKGTQIATMWTDANGTARLCDAPLHAVDIVVGTYNCGLVLVRNVKPTWPETRRVFVTYDETRCDGEFTFEARHCQVLLRIQDEGGRPLAGARFDGKPSGESAPDVSDVFGRLFRTVKRGEKLEGVVIMEGSEPARVSEQCRPLGDDAIELKVVLRKR